MGEDLTRHWIAVKPGYKTTAAYLTRTGASPGQLYFGAGPPPQKPLDDDGAEAVGYAVGLTLGD